jgi:hypothetical protein
MFLSKLLKSTGVLLLCAPLLLTAGEGFAKPKKKKGAASGEKAPRKKNEGGGGGGTYAYGMAGCGLGSVVFKNDTKGSQITASTLNSTGFQTSAISCTGSSNCSKDNAEAHRMEQEVFVAANLRNLEVDVSSGGGTYVQAFAEVLGCSSDDNYGEFLEVSRANFKDIFGASDPSVVYARYMQALRGSSKLANGCERMVYKS